MQGYLTTHVLDTARGCPAAGLKIELIRHVPESGPIALQTTITNADGRTDGPILPQDAFKLGSYELIFHAGAYLRAQGQIEEDAVFLDMIPIRFEMRSADHYHVPFLLSPYGYSTYRGS